MGQKPAFFYLRSVRTNCLILYITLIVFHQLLIAQSGEDYNPKKEISFDGKKYRVHNNYLTIGAGKARNTYVGALQFNAAADFNFHIKQHRYQTGIILAGKRFGSYDHLQFHVCYGKRFEQNRYNLAGYLGGSYSSMNRSYEDSIFHPKIVKSPGLYACVQMHYKFKYDLGIGCCFFADFNSTQSLYGIRLELFFSGAYRRAVRGEENLNQKAETYTE